MRSRVKLKFPIYVPRGGQDHSLHGKHPVLSWVSRCDIVGDVAAGLQYVHNIKATCCQKKKIEASNMLLELDASYRAWPGHVQTPG